MQSAIRQFIHRWKEYKKTLKANSYATFFVIDLTETIVLALLAALFIRHFFVQTSFVFSGSMIPTLSVGDRLVVNKMAFWFRDPVPGEIVLFESPHGDDKEFVKRLIAVPGDTVEVKSGRAYVNDEPVHFPAVMIRQDLSQYPKTVVPQGSYFVMGDNRGNSSDSRIWGFVSRDQFIGKAWFTFWPISESEVLR